MARLPDPTGALSAADREAFQRMAAARAGAEGRAALGDVYVRMFNSPAVARAVGALGEHLRFAGVLPDDARELVILRHAARQRFGYMWSHHLRPARQAGIPDEVVAALAGEGVPDGLAPERRAVVEAVDAVVARRSIPAVRPAGRGGGRRPLRPLLADGLHGRRVRRRARGGIPPAAVLSPRPPDQVLGVRGQ